MRTVPLLAALLAAGACRAAPETESAAAGCRVIQQPIPLPAGLEETSGAEIATRAPEVVWTHNDSGGDAVLFAVRPTGQLLATVPVLGADNVDWEDVAAGPCPEGGACLYVADVGDNVAKRDTVALYVVPEPDAAAPEPVTARRFPVVYPGGPRDAESIVVLPSGEVYLLTKARTSNLALYRYPQPLRADETVELEHVADLSADRLLLPDQVTGADASPDGRWIAVRDYRSLRVHPAERLLRGDTTGALRFELDELGEPQGEGVAILDDGRIVLTSEGVGPGAPGLIAVLACTLPEPTEAAAAPSAH